MKTRIMGLLGSEGSLMFTVLTPYGRVMEE